MVSVFALNVVDHRFNLGMVKLKTIELVSVASLPFTQDEGLGAKTSESMCGATYLPMNDCFYKRTIKIQLNMLV